VIDLDLTWQEATAAAGALAAGTLALRRSRRPRLAALSTGTRESALILALFALWQYAGSFSLLGPGGALGRSRWIWHAERVLGLPSETSVQRLFLPHPLVIEFFNLYYLSLHFPVLIATFTWLFVRHREAYRRLRTTLVALTGACLLIQLIPVAPPRMLPGTGLVDTAVLYHQSVYSSTAGFNADELSAMPSVHVGWAVLVAVAVITVTSSRWRWLALLYPAMTTLVVVATANHFWLDGIVAVLVLGLVLAGQAAWRRALAAARGAGAPRANPGQPGPGAAESGVRVANSGLYPEGPAWDDQSDDLPMSLRGPYGNNSTGADTPRSAAERDRPA
jgi:PAP2 superfamily